jgi:cytochrome oxidase assembly protein ShyY1
MSRRLPLIPTIVVAAAVAMMIGLGVWQLQRARWKEGLLARYAQADKLPPITWPTIPVKRDELPLYRHATGLCAKSVGQRAVAGENRAGEPGYVHIVDCATGAEGPGMSVEVGWSKNPNAATKWAGGLVSGVIVRDKRSHIRLVTAAPAPGLEASAQPTPTVRVSPGRNRGYAMTWFGLAVAALVIYGLAVRKRWREDAKP